MSRYIVLDVVFYAGSLNYDQGSGNYQELKKITKWDGRQYSLVSRYALRYSMLNTAKNFVGWPVDEGNILTKETGKGGGEGAIQPSPEALLSGEILEYPEFDLFGYLITSTSPPNFRSAPVRISHAVSMTPFNYDALFNANIGLANRLRKKYGELSPNPFTTEEHETYYLYSIIIDLDDVGLIDIYINKKSKLNIGGKQREINEIKNVGNDIILKFKKNEDEKEDYELKPRDSVEGKIEENNGLIHINYTLKKNVNEELVNERISKLIKTVLNLKRSIKGRDEDLSPKLLFAGIYKNSPYKTYKDRIALVDEFTEESYDEVEKTEDAGKKIVKVKHKEKKGNKPLFRIEDGKEICKEKIDEKNVITFINEIFNNKEDKISEVKIFYDSTIELEKLKNNNK